MSTLEELYKKRKMQIENRNGTEALRLRIEKLKTLTGKELVSQAERLKGYIEALYENQLMTLQDAKDWEWIVENKAKGFH